MLKKYKSPKVNYDVYWIERLRKSETLQIEYLKSSFEENSDMPQTILLAIRQVAEARGFKNFAEKADLNRENLYRVLSKNGNPRLDTFFKILEALGLKLSVEVRNKVS